MEIKRKISVLIPYKVKNDEVLVYLQRRNKDAKRLPDYFGLFGGHTEGEENPEQTLRREIKEELNFDLKNFSYFKAYEFEQTIKTVFQLEVGDDFEKQIIILEGQYGKWFSEKEIFAEPKLIEHDKIVFRDFYNKLNER